MFENFITDITNRFIAQEDFVTILVLLFLMLVIYGLLDMSKLFEKNKAVSILLSICVSFMAIFFMPKNWLLYFFVLPAGTFGTIVFFSLPFIIILLIAHGSYMSSVGRKFLLGMFTIIQGVSWYQQFPTLDASQNRLRGILFVIALATLLLDSLIHKLVRFNKN